MGLPAETTSSPTALRRTMEVTSLDLMSSLVRPLTSSLSTASSWGCRTAPSPRKRSPRMNALRVLAISLERLRRSVLAAVLDGFDGDGKGLAVKIADGDGGGDEQRYAPPALIHAAPRN